MLEQALGVSLTISLLFLVALHCACSDLRAEKKRLQNTVWELEEMVNDEQTRANDNALEVHRLHGIIDSLTARCARQAELLARRAEKQVADDGPNCDPDELPDAETRE